MQPDQSAGPVSRPRRKMFVVAGAVAILIVALIGGLIMHHHTQPVSQSQTTSKQAIIQVTANGFVPATLKVKGSTTVVWKNTDSAPHQVASNPYPADNGTPGLKSSVFLS